MLHKHRNKSSAHQRGFTLLEILIALFIFTIVSMIIVTALHTILTTQSVVEKNTARFNQLHLALIILSRDMEQVINRPIINASGTHEAALSGTHDEIRFTHAGLPNPFGDLTRSTLQRVHYFSSEHKMRRETWPALDITHDTPAFQRDLLENIEELHFEYLDKNGKFHSNWPAPGSTQNALPRAVRVYIVLKNLGKVSQLYVMPN